jgi:hypothetical protein
VGDQQHRPRVGGLGLYDRRQQRARLSRPGRDRQQHLHRPQRHGNHQGYAAVEYQPGTGNSTRRNLGWANARSTPFYLPGSGPADNQNLDPRFVNPAARDLRVAAGSPAINTGESFGLLLDADRRPRTGTPDKGAYEAG